MTHRRMTDLKALANGHFKSPAQKVTTLIAMESASEEARARTENLRLLRMSHDGPGDRFPPSSSAGR
ncbi:hypothetical protein [Alsobacter sp. R-9]